METRSTTFSWRHEYDAIPAVWICAQYSCAVRRLAILAGHGSTDVAQENGKKNLDERQLTEEVNTFIILH